MSVGGPRVGVGGRYCYSSQASPASNSSQLQSASSSGGAPQKIRRRKTPQDEYPICGTQGQWLTAEVKGCVRKPRLDKDDAKLKELCKQCRDGNFREVRAIAVHYPHLLSLTDKHGFGPLHHAEMSGNSDFVAQVLKLYRNPKSFALKVLCFETEAEMWQDQQLGFEMRCMNPLTDKNTQTFTVLVERVPDGSKASTAGIMPGDWLEAVRNDTSLLESRMPPPKADDVFGALRGPSWKFPISLEFRGSALVSLLAKDGWTPCHGAAGHGVSEQRNKVLAQMLNEVAQAPHTRDVCGAAPLDIYHIGKARRRPLSAGPRGAMLARDFQEGALRPDELRPAAVSRPTSATGSPSRGGSKKPPSRPASALPSRTPTKSDIGVAASWAIKWDVRGLCGPDDEDVDLNDVYLGANVAPPPADIPSFEEPAVRARDFNVDPFLLGNLCVR